MDKVTRGLVVAVTYSIDDAKGELVERIDLPVHILYGEKSGLIEKVDAALEGRAVGDKFTVDLTPEEGFGAWHEDLTFTDLIENVPEEYRYLGATAEFQNDSGEVRQFVVTQIDNASITLDGNHPFAGKALKFHLKIDAIREPTAAELANGVDATPGGGIAGTLSSTLH
ncbi:MAG: peptidylprolyl isomerase [Gammaproteobacteria bacterium]|nr:peptidylprolyl isomerase [Gammaproteobacteria bacterium]